MEKKRSIGVVVIGTIKILIAFSFWCLLLFSALGITNGNGDWRSLSSINLSALKLILAILGYLTIYIVDAIFLISLKNWARVSSVIMDIIITLIIFFYLIGFNNSGTKLVFFYFLLMVAVLHLSFICYLTLPTVKEQFKEWPSVEQ